MKTGDGILSLAGVAAGVSLLLGAASMTIALIAAASPPVSQYLNDAESSRLATWARWVWLTPAIGLLLSLWASAQVVLRRPVLTSTRWLRCRAPAGWALLVGAIPTVAFAALSVFAGVASIRTADSRHITDNMSFAGLCLPLGGVALIGAMISSWLFQRWYDTTLERGVVVQSEEPSRHGAADYERA